MLGACAGSQGEAGPKGGLWMLGQGLRLPRPAPALLSPSTTIILERLVWGTGTGRTRV